MIKSTLLSARAREPRFAWLVAFIFFIGCGDADPDPTHKTEECAAGHALIEGECVPQTEGCEAGEVREGEECIALPSVCDDAEPDLGEGTESNPYIICDRAALEAIAAAPEAHYALGANIDLSATPWEPIASFAGVLNGRGFAISGLNIHATAEDSTTYWGLFRTITRLGEIRDLTLSKAELAINGGNRVGALAGHNQGRLIRVQLHDSSVWGQSTVGGLIGKSDRGIFRGIHATGLKISGNTIVGGLVAAAAASSFSDLRVEDIEVEAAASIVGGLIGSLEAMDDDLSTASAIRAEGVRVSAGGNFAGGIAGEMKDGSIVGDIQLRDASIKGASDIGGVIGLLTDDGALMNLAVAELEVNGSSARVGGIVGRMRHESSLSRVSLAEAEIVGAGARVGGIAGYAHESSSLSDLIAHEISIHSHQDQVGGFVGDLQDTAKISGAQISDSAILAGDAGGLLRVGGAVGLCFFGATIDRIHVRRVQVEVHGQEGIHKSVGGVVGYARDGCVLEDVHVEETSVLLITHPDGTSHSHAGGLIGRMDISTLNRASAYRVDVELRGQGWGAGGIAGWINERSKVYDLSAHGSVKGDALDIGGIVGNLSWDHDSTLERAYSLVSLLNAEGVPLADGERTRAGPVAGRQGPTVTTDGLYFWNDATPVRNGIGELLMTAAFSHQSSFPGWDFTDVWEIKADPDGFTRPLLRPFESSVD